MQIVISAFYGGILFYTVSTHILTMGEKRGPKPEVTDEEILDVFRNSQHPFLIASEVAEELPIKRRGVYDRLKQLEDEGILQSKRLGGRTTGWWYPGHTSTTEFDS